MLRRLKDSVRGTSWRDLLVGEMAKALALVVFVHGLIYNVSDWPADQNMPEASSKPTAHYYFRQKSLGARNLSLVFTH